MWRTGVGVVLHRPFQGAAAREMFHKTNEDQKNKKKTRNNNSIQERP
jgi:hypothetical protein